MKSDGILGLAHHYASDRGLRGETFMSTLRLGSAGTPGCRSVHPGVPSCFALRLEDGHVPQTSGKY